MTDRGWYSFDLVDGRVINLRLHFGDRRTWRALLATALDLVAWWPGHPRKPRPLP